MPPKIHKPNCDYFRNPEHCNCDMPPKTKEEWERAINKTVEAGKERADWFEPSAEVILASTAKEQLLKLVAEKDKEREAAVSKVAAFAEHKATCFLYNCEDEEYRISRCDCGLYSALTALPDQADYKDNYAHSPNLNWEKMKEHNPR